MISLSEKSDIPYLKHLWHEVFEDDMAFIDSFFEQLYEPENTLVCRNGGIPVAMLYMMPYSVYMEQDIRQVCYYYALATEKAYRNRGIMSRMVEAANKLSKERKYDFAALIPAEESLFGYYERFGFAEGYLEYQKKKAEKSCAAVQVELSADDVWGLCKLSRHSGENRIQMSRKQNEFWMQTFLNEGGICFGYETKEKEVRYALLMKQEKLGIVYETTEENIQELADRVFGVYGCEELVIWNPLCGKIRKKKFMMMKSFTNLSAEKIRAGRFLM